MTLAHGDLNGGDLFYEMHAPSEKATTKIETLRKWHVQASIEHELRATGFACNLPNGVEQLRADAVTLQRAIYNQIVDIHEAAVQQIGQFSIPGEADDAVRSGRAEQTIAFSLLRGHLSGKRAGVRQMRAQLPHNVECGQQRIGCVEMNEAKRGYHERLHEDQRSRYPVHRQVGRAKKMGIDRAI